MALTCGWETTLREGHMGLRVSVRLSILAGPESHFHYCSVSCEYTTYSHKSSHTLKNITKSSSGENSVLAVLNGVTWCPVSAQQSPRASMPRHRLPTAVSLLRASSLHRHSRPQWTVTKDVIQLTFFDFVSVFLIVTWLNLAMVSCEGFRSL